MKCGGVFPETVKNTRACRRHIRYNAETTLLVCQHATKGGRRAHIHRLSWHPLYINKVEIKKSDKANIESQRPVSFLIGLIVVLATIYVAMNFTTTSGDDANDSMQYDELSHDLDLMPAVDKTDMIAATPAPTKPTAKKLNIVDEARKDMEKQAAINDMRTVDGDGTATTSTDDDSQSTSKAIPPVAVDGDDNPLSVRVVEQIPEFPGGMVELMKWLTKTLHYPYWAQKRKIEGRVVVTFIINRDGSLADIKIAKSVDPLLDNEALRVVRLMPHWKPGMQNAKPCRTMFAIPIEFRL